MRNGKEKTRQTYTIIGADVSLQGNIFSKGLIRIDGTLIGRIECESTLVIGETGRVEGDVVARGVLIAGELLGNATVQDHIEIRQHGRLHGDIITSKLVMEQGVIFEGKCQMNPEQIIPQFSDSLAFLAAESQA
ncbi:polymer-forming cytoskeletal protein [Thermodesulfobacteriota bacterium]